MFIHVCGNVTRDMYKLRLREITEGLTSKVGYGMSIYLTLSPSAVAVGINLISFPCYLIIL